MAGIPDDELDSFLPKPLHHMQDSPETIRARSVIRDIYARHGIDPGTPLVDPTGQGNDAVTQILGKAMDAGLIDENGQPLYAWANPEEAANAQAEYAAKGKTPQEVEQRFDESIYLLPPEGYEYNQNYGRDVSFLESMPAMSAAGRDFGNRGTSPQKEAVNAALSSWDSSNMSPLYRKNWRQGTYASTGGAGKAFANVMSNPDLSSGHYMNISETVPNFIRSAGSGEMSPSQAATAANAERLARQELRLDSPVPILREKDQSTVADRIREHRKQLASAAIPEAGERWERTLGFRPPQFVQNAGDFLISMIDPTILIPAVGAGRGAVGIAKKGAQVAGAGWTKPALQQFGKQVGVEFGKDGLVEQGIGHAISGVLPPTDSRLKSDQEVEQANAARARLEEQLGSAPGVSRARDEAYKRLQEQGKASTVPFGF
jgi:hypothetical protein